MSTEDLLLSEIDAIELRIQLLRIELERLRSRLAEVKQGFDGPSSRAVSLGEVHKDSRL
jgi:uncharacterized small protein (DUF1192 family)